MPMTDRRAVRPNFSRWSWRAGNAFVSAFARVGIGPIALLTTRGRTTGKEHTVPVVPVDHGGSRWLVAPYGVVEWVENARASASVTLRHGRHRQVYEVREASSAEAGAVLKQYAHVATRTRRCFSVPLDAPAEAYAREASQHPVFELRTPAPPVDHVA